MNLKPAQKQELFNELYRYKKSLKEAADCLEKGMDSLARKYEEAAAANKIWAARYCRIPAAAFDRMATYNLGAMDAKKFDQMLSEVMK